MEDKSNKATGQEWEQKQHLTGPNCKYTSKILSFASDFSAHQQLASLPSFKYLQMWHFWHFLQCVDARTIWPVPSSSSEATRSPDSWMDSSKDLQPSFRTLRNKVSIQYQIVLKNMSNSVNMNEANFGKSTLEFNENMEHIWETIFAESSEELCSILTTLPPVSQSNTWHITKLWQTLASQPFLGFTG